ncbi:hypothetical protein Dda_6216 [Drechslerella dactyloides]|uniref:DUF5672 domain-containing protein n=1 Tax=Drechslerella dactyloides TaxID=74499 RepID=A0AAD6NH34_DREDA|nr:hypothetical protein Dda_6216 [Drechslerella dactyloides]
MKAQNHGLVFAAKHAILLFVGVSLIMMVALAAITLSPHSLTKYLLNIGKHLDKITAGSSGAPLSIFNTSSKVAIITDATFTNRHIPLILHFNSVLGPAWPIIYFTSQSIAETYLSPASPNSSAVWNRAIDDGRIQVRIVPDSFNLTTRAGVNLYLSSRWLWEQLHPARHVLVFQADAMICANAHKTVDDFLEYDFIGAPISPNASLYNGGLSLRNRSMIMDLFDEGLEFANERNTTKDGEDFWFSTKFGERGAKLPTTETAMEFACQYKFNMAQKRPVGYHKIHKKAQSHMAEIAEWCPEISLTAPGRLRG